MLTLCIDEAILKDVLLDSSFYSSYFKVGLAHINNFHLIFKDCNFIWDTLTGTF